MNRPRLRYRVSLVATIGLAIVWMLLWGELTLGAAAWGLLVALLIQLLFPLPDVPELEHRIHQPSSFSTSSSSEASASALPLVAGSSASALTSDSMASQ